MASTFCGTNQPDFVVLDCGTELGGIVAVALIAKGQNPTLANLREATFWTSKLNASPQKYFLIPDTRGSYPGGTPVEEDGFGRVPVKRTGADHEMTFEVLNIEDNRNFMAAVNQTDQWDIVYVTMDNLGFYAQDASVYGTPVIDQSIKSTARWKVSVKWSDDLSNPQVFEAPAAIFGS